MGRFCFWGDWLISKRFLRAPYRRQENGEPLYSLEEFVMEVIKEIIAEITHEVLAIDELLGFEGDEVKVVR